MDDGVAFLTWVSGFEPQDSEDYLSNSFLNSLKDGTSLVPG